MITSLSLRNFKAHVETDLPLERLTVLVGPNGAGKTSALRALHLLSRFVSNQLSQALGSRELEALPSRGQGGAVVLAAKGALERSPWEVSAEIRPPGSQGKPGGPWGMSLGCRGPGVEGSGDFTFEAIGNSPLWKWLEASAFLRFEVGKIAARATRIEDAVVQEDGGNTSGALAALKLRDDRGFEAVEKDLRAIVPSVEAIRFRQVPRRDRDTGNTLWANEVVLDFSGAPDIPAFAVSEGTLVTLALLTALHSPSRPKLVLIDDIGQSLHPTAQISLIRQLKGILERSPDLQIIATTHSPYVLDGLEPSQVLVCFPRQGGGVAVRPLSQHPDVERAKGSLSPGQLWSLDPEDWVLDAERRP